MVGLGLSKVDTKRPIQYYGLGSVFGTLCRTTYGFIVSSIYSNLCDVSCTAVRYESVKVVHKSKNSWEAG